MKHVLVAGGAGFIGSHLTARLLELDLQVSCVDNFSTSDGSTLARHRGDARFDLAEADITSQVNVPATVDTIFNLASPASPADYMRLPIETMAAGSVGTLNLCRAAVKNNARLIMASTSEVYGDPTVHPQPESYFGNVNPVGPRAVYDESKRFGEALVASFHRQYELNAGIVRLFNCYGPNMRVGDGRAVPTFIEQALANVPLTVAGEGDQTRSLCYVDDIVDGLIRFARSVHRGPLNLGNPEEVRILDLAREIIDITGSTSEVLFIPSLEDDPRRRLPDISMASRLLGWRPAVSRLVGLRRTIAAIRSGTGGHVSS